jgi:hypothetical protein
MEVADEAAIDGETESFIRKEGFGYSVSDLHSATYKIVPQQFVDIVLVVIVVKTSGLGTKFVVGTPN